MDTLFGEDDLMPEPIPPGKEFVSKLEELIKATELNFDPTPGFGDFRAFFPSEAVAHPAKMNASMLRYLIERYTKPGETVLDPMGGTGSTGVEAARAGRDAILVELEEKFVRWQEQARARVEAVPALDVQVGRITIIKGDARNLSTLLGRADAIVSSPPFSDTLHPRKGVLQAQANMAKAGYDPKYIKGSFEQPNQQLALATDGYGKDPANLGNLKHGEVDTAIFSPPYTSATAGGAKGIAEEGYEGKYGKDPGLKDRNDRAINKDDPAQISNLKMEEDVDAVVTSPPFAPNRAERWPVGKREGSSFETHQKMVADHGGSDDFLSEDPAQIDNLALGEVDAVVTSPPYKTRTDGGGVNETGIPNARGVAKDQPHTLEYSEDKEGNIGEIKELGDVDAVVTSPPFANSANGPDRSDFVKGADYYRKVERKTTPHTAEAYSSDPANLGNLPEGKIDEIITSPPYAESVIMAYDSPEMHAFFAKMLKEKGFIEWEGVRYTEEEWRKKNHGRLDGRTTKGIDKGSVGYSASKENIGNLPVDAVISSPPYEKSEAFQDTDFLKKISGDQDVKVLNGETKGHLKQSARTLKYKAGGHASQGHAPSSEAESAYLDRAEKGRVTHPESIGKLERETYLAAMFKVYGEMLKVLKPGGRAVIVIKPFQRDKKIVDLPFQTWLLLQRLGFELEDVLKLRLQNLSFWRILAMRRFPDVPIIRHEYVLVCRKPASE